jgi:solute carrier family 25 carnitine/acylcarnitine transporter 20/29
VRSEGLRGLYRGTGLTLLRDVPGSVAYYGAYEIIRNHFAKEGDLSPGVTAMAGGMAGVSESFASSSPLFILFFG